MLSIEKIRADCFMGEKGETEQNAIQTFSNCLVFFINFPISFNVYQVRNVHKILFFWDFDVEIPKSPSVRLKIPLCKNSFH